jgi:poly-gamma-glutamate synthesis protein (capsule biosynthesis protein)
MRRRSRRVERPTLRSDAPGADEAAGTALTLFFCGDVMTGRGIDQVLPHPSEPRLHEPYATSAAEYVKLAEEANGPIPSPVDFAYVWGDALAELGRARLDARIINLETSVTQSEDYWRHKSVHYRMHPDNVPCITAARIDCCVLANNHVLDYGYSGLGETLDTLTRAGVQTAGAGRNLDEAAAPAVIDVTGKGRVVVFGFGTETSGIVPDWAAATDRAGVNFLPDLSDATVRRIRETIERVTRPLDVVVASIHWGGNWGFEVPDEHVRFAHALVDAGVDVVHGHSSHHVRPIEVFQGKLVLYGCGNFLDDYEGIRGHDRFRPDLSLTYVAAVEPATGRLAELRMTPMQIRTFRARHASRPDAEWLCDTINRESRRFDFAVRLTEEEIGFGLRP